MASLIDFSKPIYGNPTTESVRLNFEIAQSEITTLQTLISSGPFVPLNGGIMQGFLTLHADPRGNFDAATKQYVDSIAFGGGGGGGMPDAPKDGMFYARGGGVTSLATENDWTNAPLFTRVRVGPDKDTTYFNMLYDANYNYYDFNNLDSALRFTRATKLLELMTNSQVIAGFSDSAITLNRQIVSSAGINFGGTSVTDPLDFSRHITLYGGFGGLSVTPNRVNIVAAGELTFVQGGTDVAAFDNLGMVIKRVGNTIRLSTDPSSPLDAVTKQYVDNKQPLGGPYLPLTGGIVTGETKFNGPNPQILIDGTGYRSLGFTSNGSWRWHFSVTSDPTTDFTISYMDDAGIPIGIALMISRATGLATIAGDPTTGLGIATKQYVDTKQPLGGPYLPLIGGILTGHLTLSGQPTTGLHATTKDYVDTAVAAGSGGTGGIPEAPNDGHSYLRGNLGWASGGSLTSPLRIAVGDGTLGLLLSGLTKGLRFTANSDNFSLEAVDNTGVASYQPLSLSGSAVLLNADTVVSQYVNFTLGRDPTTLMHATTKQYVDNAVAAGSGGIPEAPNDGHSYLRGNLGWSSGGFLTNRLSISLGANADINNLAIDLYGGVLGISVTTARLNYLVAAANTHNFVVNGADKLVILESYLQSNVPIALPYEPTSYNQAVTKQYSDRNKTRGLIDITPGVYSPTVSEVDFAYIYIYGGPTGPATITMPVATTVRVLWTLNNTTPQPVTIKGVGGGEITIHSGASQAVWTDTGGIYPLYNNGQNIYGSQTFNNGAAFINGGINFSNQMADASNLMGKHIELFPGWGGFTITPGALNAVAGGTVATIFSDIGINLPAGKTLSLDPTASAVWGGVPTTWSHLVNKQYADTKLSLDGGVVTGPTRFNQSLTVGLGTNSGTILAVDSAETTAPGFAFFSAGRQRWLFAMDHFPNTGDTTPGAGDGAGGENFSLFSYTNSGGYHGQPLTIARDTGQMALNMATLQVARDPTTALEVATKQYVDNKPITGGPYLPLVGGTLTGNLVIDVPLSVGWSGLTINHAAGMANYILGKSVGSDRWQMRLGDHTAESGGDVGSNFALVSFNDAGQGLTTPLSITRAGAVSISGQLYVSGSRSVTLASAGVTNPTITCQVPGSYACGFWLETNGTFMGIGQADGIGTPLDNWLILQYAGSRFLQSNMATNYKAGGGVWDTASDQRIKTVTGDYELGLAEILQLNPIRYRYRGNDSLGKHLRTMHSDTIKEYVGFAAQDVEAIFPEMVSSVPGMIDGEPVMDLRTMNLGSLPMALVNAVKELYGLIDQMRDEITVLKGKQNG